MHNLDAMDRLDEAVSAHAAVVGLLCSASHPEIDGLGHIDPVDLYQLLSLIHERLEPAARQLTSCTSSD